MGNRRFGRQIAVAAVLLFLLFLWQRGILDLLLLTHISFYGKVVDEKGSAVPDADVHLSFVDTFWDNHTKVEETTDTNGLFHASGYGLGIAVQASKHGYYCVRESNGMFGYSKAAGMTNRHADSGYPAVLMLRKAGKIEPSIIAHRHTYEILGDGTAVVLNLTTGNTNRSGQGDVEVKTWVHDQGRSARSNQPFDWQCIITVLGGGLIQRIGEFDFEAPVDGYVGSDEINMPITLGNNWRDYASRDYFVKLKSGSYARLRFSMSASTSPQFELISYLNPELGARNLEPDPDKYVNTFWR